MKEKMTITQYASLVGVERDTIHKRIKNNIKLTGVIKTERIGAIYVLTVDKNKVK